MEILSTVTELMGKDGDDRIYGHSSLFDGTGVESEEDNDWLAGGKGSDKIYGGAGDDYLEAGEAKSVIYIDADNPYTPKMSDFESEGDEDTIYAGSGRDQVIGGSYKDRIYGGEGTDAISAGIGRDDVYGGSETDTIYGDSSIMMFEGTAGPFPITCLYCNLCFY